MTEGIDLGTDDTVTAIKRFLGQQFTAEVTTAQIVFDVVAGIVLPLFCLALDPFVFRYGFGHPLLGWISIASYFCIALGIVVLVFWHCAGWPAGFLAGALRAGAIFASLVGLALLPFSLYLLFAYGIGMIGLIPWLTAFAFWRNASRASAIARQRIHSVRLYHVCATIGFTAMVVLPAVAQRHVNQKMSRLLDAALIESTDEAVQIARDLRPVGALVDTSPLAREYLKWQHTSVADSLAESYAALTGRDITRDPIVD